MRSILSLLQLQQQAGTCSTCLRDDRDIVHPASSSVSRQSVTVQYPSRSQSQPADVTSQYQVQLISKFYTIYNCQWIVQIVSFYREAFFIGGHSDFLTQEDCPPNPYFSNVLNTNIFLKRVEQEVILLETKEVQ